MGAILKVRKLTTFAEGGILVVAVAVVSVAVFFGMQHKTQQAQQAATVQTSDTIPVVPLTATPAKDTVANFAQATDTQKTTKAVATTAAVKHTVKPTVNATNAPVKKKTDGTRENVNVTF
jgi:hypothetical protein